MDKGLFDGLSLVAYDEFCEGAFGGDPRDADLKLLQPREQEQPYFTEVELAAIEAFLAE